MAEEISIDLEQWADNQDTSIELDVHGRIIDYVDPAKRRPNTPEERVRQLLVRSLNMEYGYDLSRLALEVPIYKGTAELKDDNGRPSRADVVIYRSSEACKSREQSDIFAIFETKKPDEQAGFRQLASYLAQTLSEGGGWTNGKQIRFFRRFLGKDGTTQSLKPWPGFPKDQQAWDAVGKYKKSQLAIPQNLKPVFVKCHNALYRSGISSEDVAMDMVRLILAKRQDELSLSEDCRFYCTPSEYETTEGRQKVAERVHRLFTTVRDANLDVFDESEKITANDAELAEVVSQVQMYSFTKADLDVIGAAYEVYVASHLKGERGQYFTNRLLIRLIVSIADPDEADIVLDPACGSGGFLVATLKHVRDKIDHQASRSKESREVAIEQIRRNLYGVDISPKLVKVAQANMMLGKDGHSGIAQGDSLSDVMVTLPDRVTRRCGLGAATIVVTNPPFGSSSQHRITSREKLDLFDLGFKWEPGEDGLYKRTDELNREGHPPEVLFMERCIQWAKPGGKIGIVMARGQVDDVKSRAMRSMLLARCQILAIVNAHEDSFEPFNGSKATLIIVQKLKKNERPPKDYKIFMGISKKIGQNSRGQPIFRVDDVGEREIINGQPVLDHDVDDIIESWRAFKKGAEIKHPFCFSINRSQISGPDLSLNPVRYLPRFNEATQRVIEIGNREGWKVERLGDVAKVFNGPRFKRPYAAEGVTTGDGIVRYFTGTAMTQSKGENIKYFDMNKASKIQKKQIEQLTIHTSWILITDSGTIGRVIFTLPHHDGVVATNNLIRVIIEDDELLRAYIYQFLHTELGQNQLRKNVYGTNQDHLEPRLVQDVMIPLPKDQKTMSKLGQKALEALRYSALAQKAHMDSLSMFHEYLGGSRIAPDL